MNVTIKKKKPLENEWEIYIKDVGLWFKQKVIEWNTEIVNF